MVMVSSVWLRHQPRYQDDNHRDCHDDKRHELARRIVAPPDAPNAFR
jgi:hypothetical protein